MRGFSHAKKTLWINRDHHGLRPWDSDTWQLFMDGVAIDSGGCTWSLSWHWKLRVVGVIQDWPDDAYIHVFLGNAFRITFIYIFFGVYPFGEVTFVYSFTSTMFLTSVGCRRMCSRCGPSPQHCLRFCLSIWNWVAKDWTKGRLHHLFYSFTICNYLWQICTEFTIDILRTLAAGLLARQGWPAL